jgi:hypothetical protein
LTTSLLAGFPDGKGNSGSATSGGAGFADALGAADPTIKLDLRTQYACVAEPVVVSNYLIQLCMCVAYRTAAQLNLKEVIEQRGLKWLVQYNSMGLALWSSRGLGWQSLEALERWNSREPEQEQQQMAKPG